MKNKIGIIRPVNLLIIAATMLVIFIKYKNEEAENYIINIILLILPAILTAAGGYTVNDIYDIEADKINKPERLFVGHHLSVRQSWILYFLLSIASIGISCLFSLQYAIVNICLMGLLYLYSLKLKGLPLIGNLVVALCSSAVIATCILSNTDGDSVVKFETYAGFFNFGSYIVFAFFVSLIRELVKDMQDIQGDTAVGLKTYPIVAGIKGARILIYIFCGMEIIVCGLYSFITWGLDMYSSSVIMGIITISLFVFINYFSRSKSSDEFGKASKFLKYIMFAGVINLIFS